MLTPVIGHSTHFLFWQSFPDFTIVEVDCVEFLGFKEKHYMFIHCFLFTNSLANSEIWMSPYQQFCLQYHGHQKWQSRILSSSLWSVPPWCQCIRSFHISQNTRECGTPQYLPWCHQQRSSSLSDGRLVYWSPKVECISKYTPNNNISIVTVLWSGIY